MPWLVEKQFIPWPTKKVYCSKKCPNRFLVYCTDIPYCTKHLCRYLNKNNIQPGENCPAYITKNIGGK